MWVHGRYIMRLAFAIIIVVINGSPSKILNSPQIKIYVEDRVDRSGAFGEDPFEAFKGN
jgi:hypothetical protein